jgi:uroporphyrinogen decarboxylase
MTYREAFREVLSHREVRPVPYTIKFTVEARERYEKHLGRPFDPVEETGSYVVASHTNNGWEEVKPGYYRDYFGVVWNKTHDRTLGVVDGPPLKGPSLGGFTFPDPGAIPVYDFVREDAKRYPDRFHMLSIGFALFERAWSLVGMENLLLYFMMEPAFVHDLLDRITEYNVAVVRTAAPLGVDCAHLGDDWGAQNGPLIAPDAWREFVKPRYVRICAAAKEAGLLVSQHSCGKVTALLPDMIEAGVDVFDPFQPEVMDIGAVRREYRGRLAFWGGLSVQETLPHGTPEDVRAETERLLREIAPGGGYVLAPSHSLTGDVPPENVDAFLKAARSQDGA